MSHSFHACSVVLALVLPGAAALAADSPQFRGPDRSGVFPAEGLLRAWPENGPRQLWSVEGLGRGFASVTIVDGRIWTTGMNDAEQGAVVAFDTRGKLLWKQEYGQEHHGQGYPGTRTTPTYDGGLLYLLSSMGQAVALDAGSGEIRWHVDLVATFQGRNIDWGITESPLVVDDKVIYTPGGPTIIMVALDKLTGKTIWTTSGLDDLSAYCSPRLFDHGTHRQIVTMTRRHMIGVDPARGELLWKLPYPGQLNIHAVSPVFAGDSIYVSDGYQQGGQMVTLATDGKSVTQRWRERRLDVEHGGVVLVNGHIFGSATNGTWYALEAASGEIKAELPRVGRAAVIYADGRLYGYQEKGYAVLVDADPANFRLISRFKITAGRGQHWAHPAIADGVLYLRHGDVLMAFDVTDSN